MTVLTPSVPPPPLLSPTGFSNKGRRGKGLPKTGRRGLSFLHFFPCHRIERCVFLGPSLLYKNKDILKNYYDALFPWLERCEKEFGFDNLEGYGQQRIYGFLAERFMSYWFKKNTKFSTLPILFKDISNYKL